MLVSEHISNNPSDIAIHQKRTLAFINKFIIKSIEFLNNFAIQCENKLIQYEAKMQKVEASLVILESKLKSIPMFKEIENVNTANIISNKETKESDVDEVLAAETTTNSETPNRPNEDVETRPRDPKYEKYFKMVHFGVPVEAVKLKMKEEGVDPTVLNQI